MKTEAKKKNDDQIIPTKFIDTVNIYRTLHPTASENTFKAHDYFTMINYMLIYKTSKNIFLKVYSLNILELNWKNQLAKAKASNKQILNNILLNDPQVKTEITKVIKSVLK